MSPRLPTPSTAPAITRVARLPVNPTRSEGMPRSCEIAGRFNDRSVGSTAATTNGIEVAKTIMKVENVHLDCACASVDIAPPPSPVRTRYGNSARYTDSDGTTDRFIGADNAYSWEPGPPKEALSFRAALISATRVSENVQCETV